MGEGCTFVLVNGTAYAWERTDARAYQMDKWDFPEEVPAGTNANVWVEFDENIFHHKNDDGGEVSYALSGTSYTFQLRARVSSGKFTLQAYLDGLSTLNNPRGSTIDLGWLSDGAIPFILSGTPALFSSSNPPVAWMQNTLPTIGTRTLRQLCIPGSHDSGMSIVTGHTGLAEPSIVLTQTHTIGTQLTLGARYFDIRPVLAAGTFKTGHYADIGVVGWQGADGQLVQDVVGELNAFTSVHKELVVLNLSHDLNTDTGREFRAFTQEEWEQLFELLTGIADLFVVPDVDPSTVDLSTIPLNTFIGNGRAAVLAIVEPASISLGAYATRGFYTYSQFNIYNVYSNTDSIDFMVADQLAKMRLQRPNPEAGLFLLSWTLTQHVDDMLEGGSIIGLAREARKALFLRLVQACDALVFPNVVYLDNWVTTDFAALVVAINDMVALGG
ncbi:PLC-like phosphodiesterase [Trametopsis cervina]|nr:PLC-like phosphodiesterase [Trametopsis cervina]